MPHDIFIRHTKSHGSRGWPQHIYIGSTTRQPIIIALQFNKWLTYIIYIYVTGKSGKIDDYVSIHYKQ